MTRKMLRFGMSALAVLPSAAIALGLGPIEVRSSLDQPLSARIPVLAAEPEQLEKLAAGLATREHFETVGVERVPVLSQLTFELVRPEGARPYIVVESKAPIREPLLDMLVEVNWPGGTLLREYSLFLDPPGRTVRAQRTTPAVTAATTPSTTPSPRATTTSPRVAPQPRRAGTFSGSSYGPVEPGETLWSIAEQVRPDRSVSVQQMMLALLDANPQAFWSNNVNSLNKGAILRIPNRAEIVIRSKRDAVAEARRQWKEWQANPSPYTQVAKADEQPPKPPVEAPAAEVPLHQVLLVPTAEDESSIDSDAESASLSALASEASAGVADGLGAPVEAQPLVRVENGGLGLRLAGLDGLSERLPAIIAVDDSVLATAAVSEVIEGRLGETRVDESESEPASVDPEEGTASSSDEAGTVTSTDSATDLQLATSAEEPTLAGAGDIVERAEIEVAQGSETAPELQAVASGESAAQALAAEGQRASADVVSPPVGAAPLEKTGLESDSAVLADDASSSVLSDVEEPPVVDSSAPEMAVAVADSTETAASVEQPSVTDDTALGESSVAGAQGPAVSLENAEPSVTDVPDMLVGEGTESGLDGESERDLEAQSSADVNAASNIGDEVSTQLSSDAEAPAQTAESESSAQDEAASALPPALRALLSWLEEPRNVAIAGGVAILFLVLLMLLVRRAARSPKTVEQARKGDRTAPMMPARAAEADSRDEGRVDPMKQADVLVAVGNCAEAGRIIADAIAACPDDESLAFKQLEVDYAAHDENAFVAHAMENRARLEANGLWENVVAMGVVLCADNPLFAGRSESEPVGDEQAEPVEIAPPPPPTVGVSIAASEDDADDISLGEPVSEDALHAMSLGSSDERTEPTLGSVDIPDDGDINVLEFETSGSVEAKDETNSDSESDAIAQSVDELIVTDEDGFFSPIDDRANSDDGDLGDALEAEFEKLELEGLGDIGESNLASETEAPDHPASEYESLDFGDVGAADADREQASDTSSFAAVDGSVNPDRLPVDDDVDALEPASAARTGASTIERADSLDGNRLPIAFEDEQGDPTFVETKLDLAAAYLELGDDAGARTLYEEVLSEGNIGQKRLADEALRKLA